jgi:hypothetical protein
MKLALDGSAEAAPHTAHGHAKGRTTASQLGAAAPGHAAMIGEGAAMGGFAGGIAAMWATGLLAG